MEVQLIFYQATCKPNLHDFTFLNVPLDSYGVIPVYDATQNMMALAPTTQPMWGELHSLADRLAIEVDLHRGYRGDLFNQLLLGSTFTIIAALLINLHWKISIHMIGVGGILGAVLGMAQGLFIELLWPVIIIVLLSGMLGTARLMLKAHNPLQIYAGFLLGFAAMFILFGF